VEGARGRRPDARHATRGRRRGRSTDGLCSKMVYPFL
jgi:hypothetical protein